MDQEGSTVVSPPVVAQPAAIIKPNKNRKPPARPLNILQEVFLMNVYYLDRNFSKFAVVGIFEDQSAPLGVLIKAGANHIFWSYDTFNQLCVHFDEITDSIDRNTGPNPGFKLDHSSDGLKVRKVFGKVYVGMRDNESTILLSRDEWAQFLHKIGGIRKYLTELWLHQESIQHFVTLVLKAKEEDDAIPPEDLPTHFVNQLVDEVNLYKKWLTWKK